jgi:hypothetical protein
MWFLPGTASQTGTAAGPQAAAMAAFWRWNSSLSSPPTSA